jgi:hypothetical protein
MASTISPQATIEPTSSSTMIGPFIVGLEVTFEKEKRAKKKRLVKKGIIGKIEPSRKYPYYVEWYGYFKNTWCSEKHLR